MLPVRGQVSGMLARPARSVKQTSTNARIFETWALSFAGRNERARSFRSGLSREVTIADYFAGPVSHFAAAAPVRDARRPGEKLPSVQKLPNDLAHPPPFRFERLSAFSREQEEFTGAAAAQSGREIPWVGAPVSDQCGWRNSCPAASRRKP